MKHIKKFFIIFVLLLFVQNITANCAKAIEGPLLGRVSSLYGYRADPYTGKNTFHYGLDISCAVGTPIYALQEGIVSFSGVKGGYGNAITIDHYYSDIPELPRIQTLYGHNSINYVKQGDFVRRGQVIAAAGSTGRSTGPHLHFGVTYKNNPINPIEYLTKLPSYLKYAQDIRSSRDYLVNKQSRNGIGGY